MAIVEAGAARRRPSSFYNKIIKQINKHDEVEISRYFKMLNVRNHVVERACRWPVRVSMRALIERAANGMVSNAKHRPGGGGPCRAY